MTESKPLTGRVAVVAGATRGAGRGIARGLGEAGATVYCTGRSTRENSATAGRPETIEETAEMVTALGGVGRWQRVDHTVEEQVIALFDRIREEHGRVDILVNDVWGGDALTEWGTPFWELSLDKGRTLLERAIVSHLITSRWGVPLMLEAPQALLVEITDGDARLNRHYRGNLFYDHIKTSIIRLARGMAIELRDHDVTAVSLTPGFLRSEAVLEHFEVTEDNWIDAAEKDPTFAHSESPLLVGRAVAALAEDPHAGTKTGRSLTSWDLAKEYGFTDADGRQPEIGAHLEDGTRRRFLEVAELVKQRFDAPGAVEADAEDIELRIRLAEDRWLFHPFQQMELWFKEPDELLQAVVARHELQLGRLG